MAAAGLGASKRCQGGAGAAERVLQFLGTPKPTPSPGLALVPTSKGE